VMLEELGIEQAGTNLPSYAVSTPSDGKDLYSDGSTPAHSNKGTWPEEWLPTALRPPEV